MRCPVTSINIVGEGWAWVERGRGGGGEEARARGGVVMDIERQSSSMRYFEVYSVPSTEKRETKSTAYDFGSRYVTSDVFVQNQQINDECSRGLRPKRANSIS